MSPIPSLNEIKKVDWQYVVNRRESLLLRSITGCSAPYFTKATGLKLTPNYSLYSSLGPYFRSSSEIEALRATFKKGGIKCIKSFRSRLIKYVTHFDRVAKKLSKIKPSQLTHSKLHNLLKEFFDSALYVNNFLDPFPITDKILGEMLTELLPPAPEKQKQNWLYSLTFPVREDIYVIEQKDFYCLAALFYSKKSIYKSQLSNHLNRYAWIGTRGWWFDRAWDKRIIEKRITELLEQNSRPLSVLRKFEESRRRSLAMAQKIRHRLGISKHSQLGRLSNLCADFAYLRMRRTAIIYRAGWLVEVLLKEPLRRVDWDNKFLNILTWSELLKLAMTRQPPVSTAELKRRQEYAASLWWRGKYYILSGKIWKNRIETSISEPSKSTHVIKGITAYPGLVRGRARLVLTTNDLNKVKRGDILIAVMTFPQFIQAMERSAAFVTDEGGILCHAAIVARESNKPCVIGTKIATKIIRNGDLIEVDASRGVVRKVAKY